MISGTAHFFRLARAGFVFAREGVLGVIDPAMVPVPARPLYSIARLFERPSSDASEARLSTALRQARAHLCEARAVSGDAAGRRRRGVRRRPRAAAGPDAAVSAGRRRSCGRGVVREAAQRGLCEFRPVDRGRLDRAGAQGDGGDGGRTARGRRESAAPRHRAALSRRSHRFRLRGATRREPFGRGAAAAARRNRRDTCAAR